jgi:predicted nucleic acid-binding protein
MNKRIKICLDLNIWCAALLAERKNRKNTACQTLVKIIRNGECSQGKTELVISWGMLNRLEKVLIKDLKISPNT